MTKNEMVGWHHQLNEHEFEQALGVGDGQGSLVCCSPWVPDLASGWFHSKTVSFPTFLGGSLGGEDLLEEGMTTHSSILACRIPWTEKPGGLQSMGSQ